MKGNGKSIEVRTKDGILILSLYLPEGEVKVQNREESYKRKTECPQTNDDKMTNAQKRYMFRLLAEKGIEGDDAHEKLKQEFQVESLAEVSKVEASKMIERLLDENNKGGQNDRVPF